MAKTKTPAYIQLYEESLEVHDLTGPPAAATQFVKRLNELREEGYLFYPETYKSVIVSMETRAKHIHSAILMYTPEDTPAAESNTKTPAKKKTMAKNAAKKNEEPTTTETS